MCVWVCVFCLPLCLVSHNEVSPPPSFTSLHPPLLPCTSCHTSLQVLKWEAGTKPGTNAWETQSNGFYTGAVQYGPHTNYEWWIYATTVR